MRRCEMRAFYAKPHAWIGSTSGVGFLRPLLEYSRDVNPATEGRDTSSTVLEEYPPKIPLSQMPAAAIPHQIISHLIDAYFANYHTSYPFIHEATFRAQYSELINRPPKHTW